MDTDDLEAQVFLEVDIKGKEANALGEAAEVLAREAADSLTSDPFAAAFFSFASGLMLRLRRAWEQRVARDAKPSRAPKRVSASGKLAKPSPGPSRIKHKYDAAGICVLDHGHGRCGLTRQRAPRTGSSAAAAVAVLPGQRSIDDQLAARAAGGGE